MSIPISNGYALRLRQSLALFYRKVGLFPLLLFGTLIILSFLNISGSSVGFYHQWIYGSSSTDNNLVAGEPRSIRSDEWIVNTQMTIAQYRDGFPYINHSVGRGQNMSLTLDVPYKEWSTVFKPQNLIFFIAPLGFAFAFRWWLVGVLLMLSVYLFSRRYTHSKALSALISVTFFFSPFIQWWYQTITLAPIYLAIFSLLCAIGIYEADKKYKKVILSFVLCYLVVCFALVLYPPFQISTAIVAILFFLVLCVRRARLDLRSFWLDSCYIAAALLVAASIVLVFFITRFTDIETMLNTAYPGHRTVKSGSYPIAHLLSNYLGPFLQADTIGKSYNPGALSNQSSLSNFSLPLVSIVLFGIAITVVLHHRKRPINLSIAASLGVLLLLLARMTVPFDSKIYGAFGLASVPNPRLLIGVGLATLFLLITCIGAVKQGSLRFKPLTVWVITSISFVTYSALLFMTIKPFPTLVPNHLLAAAVVLLYTLFTWLLLSGHFRSFILLLCVYTLLGGLMVNPLYKGLGPITSTPIAYTIQRVSRRDPTAAWITDDNMLENYATSNGARSFSGTYEYPQLSVFHSLDPARKYSYVYNRYAHVIFNLSGPLAKPRFVLKAHDSIAIDISPCDPFFEKYGIRYFMSFKDINTGCLEVTRSVNTVLGELHIYRFTYAAVNKIDRQS